MLPTENILVSTAEPHRSPSYFELLRHQRSAETYDCIVLVHIASIITGTLTRQAEHISMRS